MRNSFYRKIIALLVFVFSLSFCVQSQGIGKTIRMNKRYNSEASKFSKLHPWVSFKADHIRWYSDEKMTDLTIEYIICYERNNQQVFFRIMEDDDSYLMTPQIFTHIDNSRNDIYCINKGEDKEAYKQLGLFSAVPKGFNYLPFYVRPLDFANSWALMKSHKEVKSLQTDKKCHKEYCSYMKSEELHSFVDVVTGQLDSVSYKEQGKDGKILNGCIRMYDFSYKNRQDYLDSIFNFEDRRYQTYTKLNGQNFPKMYVNDIHIGDTGLDFPLVSIAGDTTSIREQEGWIVLSFWTTSCRPCIEHLYELSHEKDSLGCLILENNGIRSLAIEHKSNNMELIRKYAEKTGLQDMMYSAKGIGTTVFIPALGYYYLLSPDKEIVYETYDLGDYSELLKAKEDYEKKHANN